MEKQVYACGHLPIVTCSEIWAANWWRRPSSTLGIESLWSDPKGLEDHLDFRKRILGLPNSRRGYHPARKGFVKLLEALF